MPLRSGRFRFTGGTQQIITGKKGNAILRVFNSGRKPFTINGTDATHVLYPSYSIDVHGDEDAITIEAAGATDLAEGVYDFVSPLHDIRSGRFDTLNDRGYVPADPAVDGALLVADFRRVGRDVYYRFYNSGETPIEIHLTNKADTAPTDDSKKLAQDLNPDQSIDVYIKTSNQYAVWVKSATTDKAIQGIYDFIDSE
jgi:hypothetical protein